MNQTAAYAYESQFGPPSDLISINDFLRDCENIDPVTYLPRPDDDPLASTSAKLPDEWTLSPEEEAMVEAECRSVSRSRLHFLEFNLLLVLTI